MAGLVLGVESVPDGLAAGLLAGVNPVAGLYSYLFGLAGGALFTSTAFLAIQGTGAMAVVVADVDLAARDDPARALYTLSILTGVVMIVAGILRLGAFLRFVSNSVMTGFITAVGVNIVLGQLDDLTGYEADGANRVLRAIDLVLHFWEIDVPTLVVGLSTIALIVLLQRTRLGPLGLVVAVFIGSAIGGLFRLLDADIVQVRDIAEVPRSLPLPTMPVLRDVLALILPAVSLAFVGLIQGAGVSASFPNEDGSPQDVSQDFVGQGAGNVVAGLFQAMPVGGSMSGSSLMASAGARTRAAAFYAAGVMAVVILLFGGVIELVAIPSIAGLLIVIGVATIKPERVMAVAKTGTVPLTVMTITFGLTLVVPLQYAVLVGVGISTILFVIQQSTRLVTKRLVIHDDGRVEEVEPPVTVPPDDVVVLQPYGALFFATASTLIDQMPTVTPESSNSVVILRIRGADEAGATLLDVLRTYAGELRGVGSKLMIVTDNERVIRQLRVTGATDVIGPDNVYRSAAFVGETTRRAHADARRWVDANRAEIGDQGD
jgi:SulP family sulfate permease